MRAYQERRRSDLFALATAYHEPEKLAEMLRPGPRRSAPASSGPKWWDA